MPPLRRARRTGPPLLAATIAGAAVALLPAVAGAVGAPQQRVGRGPSDARAEAGAAATTHAARTLARQLGPQAVVRIDAVTHTPRTVGRTDGALTGRSGDAPDAIALDWVRDRPGLFGLDDADLDALGSPSRIATPSGLRIVTWRQSYRGLTVVGAGLRAAVAADGRLLTVQGAPLRDTSVTSTTPALSVRSALRRARADAGARGAVPRVERSLGGVRRTTTFADDSAAQLVVAPTRGGNRLAWHVVAAVDSTHVYSYLLDARSGAVLKRDNMVRHADPSGYADVWAYAPSPAVAQNGGELQRRVPLGDAWAQNADSLFGRYAFAYADVNDTGMPDEGVPDNGEVAANGTEAGLPLWAFPFTNVGGCDPDWPCSWDPATPESWRANLAQSTVQAFTFVSDFADHLRGAPFGFDEASGNFSWVGGAGDGILVETSDGANTAGGLPDDDHINNANMYTPPDGAPLPYPYPTMQMYLFDGVVHGNGGDDASVVFHEFTHGLSNRLITDEGTGEGALTSPQAGAMGEAWSDWYALDYLVGDGVTGYQADDPSTHGEIVLAASLSRGQNWLRESALDCPAGIADAAPTCPAAGGFGYADYGKVWSGGPEVHADGEIWAQTLWDLRAALIARYGTDVGADGVDGIERARQLITDGMRITPDEPTFLDARDAILTADIANAPDPAVDRRGPDHELIWEVFARRGMGWFADSDGPYDAAPVASTELPPAEPATATLAGTVTDADTGAPLAGATVRLPGGELVATTGADGRYALTPVVPTTYPRLIVLQAGYDAPPATEAVTVEADGTVEDVALRRNWARYDGGAAVLDGVDPDLGGTCAAENGIDGSLAYGWASYSADWDGVAGDPDDWFPDTRAEPREMVVMLPRKVEVARFLLDPGAICGDDDSASLGQFTIETADDTQQYRLAFDGRTTDGRFERAEQANHRLNELTPIAGSTAGVRFVRITMIRPQGGAGSSDERFMDLAEFVVHGTATPERRDPPRRDPDPPVDPPRRDPEPPVDPPRRDPEPPVLDRTPPRALGKPVLPKGRTLTALRSRAGLALRVRFDEAASVAAEVTLPAATARKLGLTRARRGTYRLSRATLRSLAARKTGTLRLKLGTAASRRLSRTRSLRVTITITATDASGNSARVVVKPLLKR